jgi:hypothetical protein
MIKKIHSPIGLFGLLIIILMTAGCYVGAGGRVVGFDEGQFFYSDGVLKTDYRAGFEDVWTATEKTVVDMKATQVEKKKKIGMGTIDALMSDEKVRISLEYVAKDITSVSVLVGMVGNNLASKLIHEKIKNHLQNK